MFLPCPVGNEVFWEIQITKNCNQSLSIFFGLVEMTLKLVHASCSLPE